MLRHWNGRRYGKTSTDGFVLETSLGTGTSPWSHAALVIARRGAAAPASSYMHLYIPLPLHAIGPAAQFQQSVEMIAYVKRLLLVSIHKMVEYIAKFRKYTESIDRWEHLDHGA